MSVLFSPLRLRGITFPHRVFVSPMCQYSADDGFANDWHLVHLGARATGGAALTMVEATAVLPEGRITLRDVGLWSDAHAEPLARIAAFLAANGSVPGIQLAHAGRKATSEVPWLGGGPLLPEQGGWTPVGPSPIPFAPGTPVPAELTHGELEQIVEAWVAATRRALRAGFRVVEIHAAHGYLLHEFLSPRSNARTDEFGGSAERRARFPLEVVRAVRATIPDELPLFVRISASEWAPGGFEIDGAVAFARDLKALGVDLVDCSSGGNAAEQQIPPTPGYQVPFAERIRRETGVATGAIGLITGARQAESIVADGKADAVLLARELLRNPTWPLRAAQELSVEIDWPAQYLRAKPFRDLPR